MLRDVRAAYVATGACTGRRAPTAAVQRALLRVPRERFVPRSEASRAHEDVALPLGRGQTISQPFVVALSTDLLCAKPGDRVLEIGTGSGYQAAVLAELDLSVFSVEVDAVLARAARRRLAKLGYARVQTCVADGRRGWSAHAPYAGILATAAVPVVPEPWVEQLAAGGRVVAPIGQPGEVQVLTCFVKRVDGQLDSTPLLPVRFVAIRDC
jgi:protein-L-isoaspartate(D-aspartate) O-methyltransferase